MYISIYFLLTFTFFIDNDNILDNKPSYQN